MNSISEILDEPKNGGRTSPLRVVMYIALVLLGFVLYSVDAKLNTLMASGGTLRDDLGDHIKATTAHQARVEQHLQAMHYLSMRICLNGSRSQDDRIACLEK